MVTPPTERMRELERLLAKIRHAGMAQLSYDMRSTGRGARFARAARDHGR
jgi:hypothetical protein